ncbi:hypothetical protein TUMSATVNIG1_60790 (plasmid) [Vibrio nigripulchritudo]|uniref:hypothetical protein n=1 Tax=Vibrio nigripulchritudo TaxID=28173 RepID=UPI00190954B6|nr:hypothetical protein [Vibrio nigripulchritudo]BCL74095.1 hypothetical protein VNTUMSATTG_60320 [Vibrio nigripulchritudo]BDU35470.1 hypothetical protein TUMSATVNIG1_60790 [Vibrio nigripulchritudo]
MLRIFLGFAIIVFTAVVSASDYPPNWNCELYKCDGNTNHAYPLPSKVVKAASTLEIFTLSRGNKGSSVATVVFDVNCPKCMRYWNNTIKPLIDEGHSVNIIPTIFTDPINWTEDRLNRHSSFICHPDKIKALDNLSKGAPLERVEGCDEGKILDELKKTKKTLSLYGLGGITPITFTRKSLLYGARKIETVKKHF